MQSYNNTNIPVTYVQAPMTYVGERTPFVDPGSCSINIILNYQPLPQQSEVVMPQVSPLDPSYCLWRNNPWMEVSPDFAAKSGLNPKYLPSMTYHSESSYYEAETASVSKNNLDKYCMCNLELNSKMCGDSFKKFVPTNFISSHLNKENNCTFNFNNMNFWGIKSDAFAHNLNFSGFVSEENSVKSRSTLKKIFNVAKIPKKMLSKSVRMEMSRVRQDSEVAMDEDEFEDQLESFSRRKEIFGEKRDDLYYKTIGRDVRKYLQERFQQFLVKTSLKEWIKNGTYFKYMKEYFDTEIAPLMEGNVDMASAFCCVATLVSYKGYSKYCNKNLQAFSLNIHDSLHNFTKSKLVNLWRMEEFRKIFIYYADELRRDRMRRFETHKTMKTNQEGYKYAFRDILKQWR